MSTHGFVLMLDDEPIQGHLFGDLKRRFESDGPWVSLERRCRLCNRLPLELLTVDGSTPKCEGLRREFGSDYGLSGPVCTDPDCTIPRKPGRPMHGPHDFRAAKEATKHE